MVAIVGRKNSGKTTVLVRLAAELHRRGHRVMTIKHGAHTFNIDPATTDTYRHYHEGQAERVAMVAPDKFALVMRWSDESPAEEVATTYMSDADVVLCEGFKASSLPRIEIHRRAVADGPLFEAGTERARTYRAIVSDVDLDVPVPVIRLDAPECIQTLASVVERDIMGTAASSARRGASSPASTPRPDR
jgi:molybdopterin-guanine dinucleotide biosynthesis protein MobB